MVENAGIGNPLQLTVEYPPTHHAEPRQATAAQRQQHLQGQAAAIQRDTAESLALLCEAVLRLSTPSRDFPTAAPTSSAWRCSSGPLELARGPVGPHPFALPHRTRTAGEPGPRGRDRRPVSRTQAGYTGLLRAQPHGQGPTLPRLAIRHPGCGTDTDRPAWPPSAKVAGDRRGTQPAGPCPHRQYNLPASARRAEDPGPPSLRHGG